MILAIIRNLLKLNKIIDYKNIQKFICDIEKNTKIIGITLSGKVFILIGSQILVMNVN